MRDGDRVDHGENNIGASLIELPQSDQQNPEKKIFESRTSLVLLVLGTTRESELTGHACH